MNARTIHRLTTAAIATLALAPASASAANFYVDQDAGDDANTCTAPGLGACEHIVAAAAKAGTGDTIHVSDPATRTMYTENIHLDKGQSLISDSPDATKNIIDGGPGGGFAIAMDGSAAASPATLTGFTIRGDHGELQVDGVVDAFNNRFDEGDKQLNYASGDVALQPNSGGSKFHDNVLVDPDPTDFQIGIYDHSTTPVDITGNEIDGFSIGVAVNNPTAVIAHNTITGTHASSGYGAGVYETGGAQMVLRGNVLKQPNFTSPNDVLVGVAATAPPGANTMSAELHGNTISGYARGVMVQNNGGPVTLSSDLITGSRWQGIMSIDDNADDPGIGDVQVTNTTVVRTAPGGAAIEMGRGVLSLDSSIVDDTGVEVLIGGASCAITNSRGPATTGNDCQAFQTSANPDFVDETAGNFHLAPGSAMIDAGNPSTPAAGETDIDGDARSIASVCDGTVRRDIGADEYHPTCVVTPPQGPSGETPDTTAPDTTIVGKAKVKAKRGKARVAFGSTEPGSHFECDLDGNGWSPCSSPQKVKHLKRGKHPLQVRAIDAAGNADATPATFAIKVADRNGGRR